MDLYVLRIRATFALSSRAERPLDCTNLVVRSIRKWSLSGDGPGAFEDSAIGAESSKCSRIFMQALHGFVCPSNKSHLYLVIKDGKAAGLYKCVCTQYREMAAPG